MGERAVPCSCGNANLRMGQLNWQRYVWCEDCLKMGPMRDSTTKAREAWDALNNPNPGDGR